MLIDHIYRPWWGWRFQNYCVSHGIEIFLFQQHGLKSFGFSYDPTGPCRIVHADVRLPAEMLFCPIDGLVDAQTLLGTPIVRSPTYAFLRALEHGEPFFDTEYIRRYVSGTLDQRWPRNVRYLHPPEFWTKYAERRAQVLTETYEPVRVFCTGGRCYVLNGKHRAALCALLGQDVRCDVLDADAVYTASLYKIHERLLRRPKGFQKTICVLDEIGCKNQKISAKTEKMGSRFTFRKNGLTFLSKNHKNNEEKSVF